MALTVQQLGTLKAAIVADNTLNSLPNNTDSNIVIAAAFNANASPDFWVWKQSITQNDVLNQVSVDGTTFDWASAGGYIARSQGERDAFRQIFMAGAINPSLAKIRAAFDDIFSGSGAGGIANRAHIKAVSRRLAKRGEKLFATGTGSTASPAVLGFEGNITSADVQAARDLP